MQQQGQQQLAVVPHESSQSEVLQLLGMIGRGTLGIVHKAKVLGHICAIKILVESDLWSRAPERFQRECTSVRHEITLSSVLELCIWKNQF